MREVRNKERQLPRCAAITNQRTKQQQAHNIPTMKQSKEKEERRKKLVGKKIIKTYATSSRKHLLARKQLKRHRTNNLGSSTKQLKPRRTRWRWVGHLARREKIKK
jgi:hypothetical protein